jgi:hypothetical protein
MSVERRARTPRLPPRWFIRLAWSVHRGTYRVFGGRVGLWRPRAHGWGTLRLTTTGRRTGQQRSVILGYFEDGPNLVSIDKNLDAYAALRSSETAVVVLAPRPGASETRGG